MVFPLIAAGAAVGLAGFGVFAGHEFGEESGKQAGTLIAIAVIGLLAYLFLRRQGKV